MIDVTPATEVDLPRLAALAQASLPDAWSEAGLRAELGVRGARLLVARGTDGGPVGYAAWRRVADELHLLSLAVDPARRRRGIGRALVEVALADAPGVRHVDLEMRADDGVAAAFYAALGFVAVGRRPGYYPDRQDALLLTRRA